MQKAKIEDATVPLPLYTCVNVKKDVSAHVFCGKYPLDASIVHVAHKTYTNQTSKLDEN